MPALLLVSALLEAVTGLVLLIAPSLVATVLLGAPLETSVGTVLARVAGAALIALGLICWFAREDVNSSAARGVVKTLLLYNVVVMAVLLYAHFGLALSGLALWPAVVAHIALAAWCIKSLGGLKS